VDAGGPGFKAAISPPPGKKMGRKELRAFASLCETPTFSDARHFAGPKPI
jgi:hypothetical protein